MHIKQLKGLALCTLVILAAGILCRPAVAQYGNTGNIGYGQLTLSVDGLTARNPGTINGPVGGGTGPTVPVNTTLTVGVGVQGVTGGFYGPPGNTYHSNSATVSCYATSSTSNIEIFYVVTHTNLTPATFTWKPTSAANYSIYCQAIYAEGSGMGTGTATTGTIVIPVM
jgi:hypothetical protein